MAKLSTIEQRIKRLQQKQLEYEATLRAQQRKLREEKKRARNRNLYLIGELAERMQISDVDKVVLAGAFAHIAEMLEDERVVAECRRIGEQRLNSES